MHENEVPFINGGEPIPWAPEIPILVSLGAIVVILGVTTVLSLWASNRASKEALDEEQHSSRADTPDPS